MSLYRYVPKDDLLDLMVDFALGEGLRLLPSFR